MRLKFGIAIVMFCICSISFGQDYKSNIESIKDVDHKIEEGSYKADDSVSADRLIIKTSEQSEANQDYISSVSFNDQEWDAIKKQIQSNKKRIISIKDGIHTFKVIDTVFLDIPRSNRESQLSGW
ncbi:hypothetical protein [Aquimarina sp. 2201CG14-23]|uniref:hypothetical protein n=1 Tax=Aquimarina mycalae TaxID=3040073 RepID=UPI002477D1E6|nr:hypothetical protein [Aquimarina sp. 2201CG14-23]MDH7445229.1 hypothetical protein [Aquimarina sp. 2201CG14-23]